MNSPLTKTVAAVALAAGLTLAATPAHAAPLPLDDAPAIDVSTVDVSHTNTGSAALDSTLDALSDYGGSTVGTDFAGSAANMVQMLPALPCVLLSLSSIKICDLNSPR